MICWWWQPREDANVAKRPLKITDVDGIIRGSRTKVVEPAKPVDVEVFENRDSDSDEKHQGQEDEKPHNRAIHIACGWELGKEREWI